MSANDIFSIFVMVVIFLVMGWLFLKTRKDPFSENFDKK